MEKYYDDSIKMDDLEEMENLTSSMNSVRLADDNIVPEGITTVFNNGTTPVVDFTNIQSAIDNELKMNQEKYEMVNHPKHYRPGIYEAINVIEAWDLNFSLGSAIKYISRCGLKPDASLNNKYKAIEDLRKAAWYINREIERIDKTTVRNS